jgi:uncharacterized protein with GYD domain
LGPSDGARLIAVALATTMIAIPAACEATLSGHNGDMAGDWRDWRVVEGKAGTRACHASAQVGRRGRLPFGIASAQPLRAHPRRFEAAEQTFEKMGVRFVDIYWTLGAHDIVGILDAPDDETATAALLAVGSLGNIRTKTLRAFSGEEMRAIIDKAI